MHENPTIIYTKTDEAPALATHSLFPIIRAFTRSSDIDVVLKDISLAGRILSQFPDYLSEEKCVEDALKELGESTQYPTANIIKLPNISASLPQLLEAIQELQSQGYPVPDYPHQPQSEKEASIQDRYNKIKGSAVNPVLREGNSDRRAPKAVKTYAQNNPHRMGAWSSDSLSHVSHMSSGDFFGSEQAVTMTQADTLRIVHVSTAGEETLLKENISVLSGEIIDASYMSKTALREFFAAQIQEAKAQGVLLSIHLKATMMKVSDPIIFGHMVEVFYKEIFETYASVIEELGIKSNNGIGDLYEKIQSLPLEQRQEIEAAIQSLYSQRPALAMVDSYKGITNLHVPNNVIIDASMPAALRTSGQMWNTDDKLQDTKFIIPDRCYAGIYQEVIDFCKKNGAFDVVTMGSVSNVGLMAKKAQEYGSHDKTFELHASGTIKIVNSQNTTLISHDVQKGDIWRMCQVKDEAIQDWVKLAVSRARAVGTAIFWLDENRAHDAQLIKKVEVYLKEHSTEGLDISIHAPQEAMRHTLSRVKAGKDTVSVTGNVLRDYLTDLFPILELGTSAKMLSIVPLIKGGGLFETGAGGSAPKHVQQFQDENHLRWDSLGEFLAIAVSLTHLAQTFEHEKAEILAQCLDQATTKLLMNGKSPSRYVHELDNRGSHFYLAMYWAQELSDQHEDADLKAYFSPIALSLQEKETIIVEELNSVQGTSMDIGGYYHPDDTRAEAAMRPSPTFNKIIDSASY